MVIWIDKKMAVEGGMTHEGRLFGIPCYFSEVDDPNDITAVPKLYVLRHLVTLFNWCFGMAAEVMGSLYNSDVMLETPVTVTGPIKL